jgi:subtilisin family serine protease
MKNLFKSFRLNITFRAFTTLMLMLAFAAQAGAGNSFHKVIRGERPAVNLASVPDDAIEENVLLIKFKDEYTVHLQQFPPAIQKSGQWTFNISEIDHLNEFYSVNLVDQYFINPAMKNGFTEKHKAWGFHLWYKIEFGTKADIRSVVQRYHDLSCIAVAEPEYKKEQINGVGSENDKIYTGDELLTLASNDPRFSEQWHYHNTGQAGGTSGADIDLLQAWELEAGKPDVIVAIIDDGIQFTHPDLYDNMWPGIGFNFVAGTNQVVPGSHGTHVGGTVAAVTNNEVGVAGIAGGMGDGVGVRLMSAQVFTALGNGGFHIAPIWAADKGAAISQNSWGYTAPNVYNQSVLDAIDYFNVNGGGDAISDGGITIFAAGNNSSSAHYYPAYYSGALSVAATNNQDKKSYYSNYGDWIDISAPGGETNAGANGGVLSTTTNSGYAFLMGTSMACPHVSGVAALVVSHAYGQLSKADVKDIMLNSADDHYAVNPNFQGLLGSGRLNAHQALLETQNYLSGVLNPIGFKANATGSSEISLNWSLNPNSDHVLLAYSLENDIGIPESNIHYQPGDVIPGGGEVLYSGNATSFLHTGLEPVTHYFYHIWAYSNSFEYSSGRQADAATRCPSYELPFNEGFEASAELPQCWTQEQIWGNIQWLIGAGNGDNHPPQPYEGNHNIYFKSQNANQKGRRSQLILPEFNLAPYDSAMLRFYYTNPVRTEDENHFHDTLHLKYKAVAHAQWQTLQTFDSDVPDWTEVTITLPGKSSSSLLAFEGESGRGHGISVDEISVSGYGNIPVHNIMATAGQEGSINPSGNIQVGRHGDASFLIQAGMNHVIEFLIVDGEYLDDADGLESYVFTISDVTQDHTLHATFRLRDYHVQVNVAPAQAGYVEGTGSYLFGSSVTLTAVENEGYVFNRWFEGGPVSFENPYSFNIYSNRQIIALYMPIIYSVSVLPAMPGSGATQGSGNFIYGGQANVSFTPNHGYIFSHWTENDEVVSTDNPYVFNVYSSHDLLANHSLAQWDIQAVPFPENSGYVEGAGIFEHGSEVELLATANENYIFAEWLENGELISTDNPFSFVANNHLSLTARFDLFTGVAMVQNEMFRVFPNPSSGVFTLETAGALTFQIIDLTRRTLLTRETMPGITMIDLSGQPKGLYILQLQQHNSVINHRLLVK